MGGKALKAGPILDVLNHPALDGMNYVEPFVGMCHIVRRVRNKGEIVIADACPLLVRMLQNTQSSRHASACRPEHPFLEHEEYLDLRARFKGTTMPPDELPLKAAYAAHACGFRGKPWGAYKEGWADKRTGAKRYNQAPKHRYLDKLAKNKTFARATLRRASFESFSDVRGALIYCDPPYAKTQQYGPDFDREAFWDFVRHASKLNVVVVSEYAAPDDMVCIAAVEKRVTLRNGGVKTQTERLWCHKDTAPTLQSRGIIKGVLPVPGAPAPAADDEDEEIVDGVEEEEDEEWDEEQELEEVEWSDSDEEAGAGAGAGAVPSRGRRASAGLADALAEL